MLIVRTLALLGLAASLLGAFLWLALTSGPAAPVPVTVASVSERPITPALFGVGTVEARYTYRIGPTIAGRVSRVEVQVGVLICVLASLIAIRAALRVDPAEAIGG